MTKQKKRLGSGIFMCLTVLLIGVLTGAQSIFTPEISLGNAPDSVSVTLPVPEFVSSFANDTLCYVADERNSLDSFFAALSLLKEGKDTVISVVQLGDSHIQCGFFSGQVMRSFQHDFGNAGRGLVTPLKLAKSNEPTDYFIRSTLTDWEKSRCIQAHVPFATGLGGIGIRSRAKKINMELLIAGKNGAGYAFNQAVLYRHPNAAPLIAISANAKTYTTRGQVAEGMACDTFRFRQLTDTLSLRSHTPVTGLDNIYYGLSLTNGESGVLFHTIGVNGAMFINYTRAAYVQQLAVLNPSLLIISLGTNETFGKRFTDGEFRGQLTAFISLVRKYMPRTALLLTTPPECFKRTRVDKKRVYVRNKNTALASEVITSFARKEGIACWDLFTMTGGAGSSKKWHAAGLMGADRVHFTKEGYRDQGILLYRALMKRYNQYARAVQDTIPNVQPNLTQTYAVR